MRIEWEGPIEVGVGRDPGRPGHAVTGITDFFSTEDLSRKTLTRRHLPVQGPFAGEENSSGMRGGHVRCGSRGRLCPSE